MPDPAVSDPVLAKWSVHIATSSEIELSALRRVLSGELAAIHMPAFEDPAACAAIVDAAKLHGFEWYENVSPPIGKIGLAQVEHKTAAEKLAYFRKAPAATETRDSIMRAGKDPFARLRALLAQTWPGGADLAHDTEIGADYFAGVVRSMSSARLHVDWAPRDARDWTIGAIGAQLAWNVYLQIGDSGGQTRIYDRAWTKELERFKTKANYGYEPEAIADADFVEIQPQAGDLVIFAPRHLHEVIRPDDSNERIAIGSFVGCTTMDEPLILWS